MSFQINEALKCMIFSRPPKAPVGLPKPPPAPGTVLEASAPFSDPELINLYIKFDYRKMVSFGKMLITHSILRVEPKSFLRFILQVWYQKIAYYMADKTQGNRFSRGEKLYLLLVLWSSAFGLTLSIYISNFLAGAKK